MFDQGRKVPSWTRDELEDQYIRTYEENINLKKQTKEQEDKMKKMATKIIRMVNDKRTLDGSSGNKLSCQEYEEKIAAQQRKIIDLSNKMKLLQEQIKAGNKTIGSVLTSKPFQLDLSNSRRISSGMNINTPLTGNVDTIRELRMQKSALEKVIRQLSEQKTSDEKKIAHLQVKLEDQNKMILEQEEQNKLEVATKQRLALQENMELIRVQRELQEERNNITMTKAQLNRISVSLQATEAANRELVASVERLRLEIQERDVEMSRLRTELSALTSLKMKIVVLENQVIDFKRENEILSKTNENLLASSPVSMSKLNASQPSKETSLLKEKLHQLETSLDLVQKERRDRHSDAAKLQAAEAEIQQLRLKLATASEQTNFSAASRTGTLQALCQALGIDMNDLETALMLVREKKLKTEFEETSHLPFLHRTEANGEPDFQATLRKSELEHSETIQELEKTRQLLAVQYRINKEYRAEAAEATNRLAEVQAEFEQQLSEYVRLLDIRAARIRQLESQLHNFAYGTQYIQVTKPSLTETAQDQGPALSNEEEQVALERGENILEIHLGTLSLTQEAENIIVQNSNGGAPSFASDQLSLFCTWDVFDFETQATTLVQGTAADFNITVQYPVRMDEFFLQYLRKGHCTIELYQAYNQSFRLLAACHLQLSLLLSDSFDSKLSGDQGGVVRRHVQGEFIGVAETTGCRVSKQLPNISELIGIRVARLDYWLRLCVPMEQTIRLYLKRTSVLPILSKNAETLDLALRRPHSQPPESTLNTKPNEYPLSQLTIRIFKASGLRSSESDRLPSPYFVYQFYNLEEYMSGVQPATVNPVFDDVHSISLRNSTELDNYLKTANLLIYLIDDAEKDPLLSCIGVASVPLIGLINHGEDNAEGCKQEGPKLSSRSRILRGPFELHLRKLADANNGHVASSQHVHTDSIGVLDMEIEWRSFPVFPEEEKQNEDEDSLSNFQKEKCTTNYSENKIPVIESKITPASGKTDLLSQKVSPAKQTDFSVIKTDSRTEKEIEQTNNSPCNVKTMQDDNGDHSRSSSLDFQQIVAEVLAMKSRRGPPPPPKGNLDAETTEALILALADTDAGGEVEATAQVKEETAMAIEFEPKIEEENIDIAHSGRLSYQSPSVHVPSTKLNPSAIQLPMEFKTTSPRLITPKPRSRSSSRNLSNQTLVPSPRLVADQVVTQTEFESLESPVPRTLRALKMKTKKVSLTHDTDNDPSSRHQLQSDKDGDTANGNAFGSSLVIHSLRLSPSEETKRITLVSVLGFFADGLEIIKSPPTQLIPIDELGTKVADLECMRSFSIDLSAGDLLNVFRAGPSSAFLIFQFLGAEDVTATPAVFGNTRVDLKACWTNKKDLVRESFPIRESSDVAVGDERNDVNAVGEVTLSLQCLSALTTLFTKIPNAAN